MTEKVWEELLAEYCADVERQEWLDQWSSGSNFGFDDEACRVEPNEEERGTKRQRKGSESD